MGLKVLNVITFREKPPYSICFMPDQYSDLLFSTAFVFLTFMNN